MRTGEPEIKKHPNRGNQPSQSSARYPAGIIPHHSTQAIRCNCLTYRKFGHRFTIVSIANYAAGRAVVTNYDSAASAVEVEVRAHAQSCFDVLLRNDCSRWIDDRACRMLRGGVGKSMKKDEEKHDDDLRAEYARSQLGVGVRGRYLERFSKGTNLVRLDPDIRTAFPTDQAVNDALRSLMPNTQSKT